MTVTLFYLSRLHNIRKYSFDAELFGDIRYSVLFGIRHYSFEVFVGIRYSVVFGIRLRIPNNLVFDYPSIHEESSQVHVVDVWSAGPHPFFIEKITTGKLLNIFALS